MNGSEKIIHFEWFDIDEKCQQVYFYFVFSYRFMGENSFTPEIETKSV